MPYSIYSGWSNIRTLNLPVRSGFGTIDPILASSYHVEHVFGEALYLKNGISGGQCNLVVKNGRYYGVLGNLGDGGQAYYDGNIQLHENTVENPIQANVDVGIGAKCPVPAKTFVNGKLFFFHLLYIGTDYLF